MIEQNLRAQEAQIWQIAETHMTILKVDEQDIEPSG
jgi:hypothetical protein